MHFEKELQAPPDFKADRQLTEDALALLARAGIHFQVSTPKRAEEEVAAFSNEWLEKFVIDTDNPAFFLNIKSPDDVRAFNEKFIARLAKIQATFNKYIDDNSDVLSEEMQKKIISFKAPFSRAESGVSSRRKIIERKVSEANSIEEVRGELRKVFTGYLKNIFSHVINPLCDGMRLTSDAAYEFILREVNEFLAELGILTLTVEIGGKVPDDDDFPYELKPSENFTSDFDKKDSVVEIERYAYVFNEGRGVENFPVCEGSAVVMIYGNSGR